MKIRISDSRKRSEYNPNETTRFKHDKSELSSQMLSNDKKHNSNRHSINPTLSSLPQGIESSAGPISGKPDV